MARQENDPGKENAVGSSSSSITDVRGGIRFTAEQAGDTYSGEVGYTSGTAQEEYVTELPLEQDEDEDDDEGQQQSASHPSTLQRQMVRTSSTISLQIQTRFAAFRMECHVVVAAVLAG